MDEFTFAPAIWARSAHLQTIFGSLGLRNLGTDPMEDLTEERIVKCDGGTRLQGYYSRNVTEYSKGLILLIHGWEGSARSTYVSHTARYLFSRGYDIFRLNLRDHGTSHHLNRGLFHGALMDEVYEAAGHIAGLAKEKPFYIIGFSLGGNFAARLALGRENGVSPRADHVICVSPLIDPYTSTVRVDGGTPLYRRYFCRKWKRSLIRKQEIFPDIYDFSDVLQMKTILEMTDILIKRYTKFEDYRHYFDQYTLTKMDFGSLSLPLTIIASKDDPVIPVAGYNDLSYNKYLRIIMHNFGGHCGFLDPFPFGCWYERHFEKLVSNET